MRHNLKIDVDGESVESICNALDETKRLLQNGMTSGELDNEDNEGNFDLVEIDDGEEESGE